MLQITLPIALGELRIALGETVLVQRHHTDDHDRTDHSHLYGPVRMVVHTVIRTNQYKHRCHLILHEPSAPVICLLVIYLLDHLCDEL